MERIKAIGSEKWLNYLAIALSVVFCLDLSFNQLNKFPASDTVSAYIRQGVEYGLLLGVYLLWLLKNLALRETEEGDSVDLSIDFANEEPPLSRYDFLEILRVTSIFLVLSYISHPHKITDVYIYLQYGLMVWQGINPYTTALGDFNSKLIPMLSWLKSTCAYGPIPLFSFIVAAAFVPLSTELGIYVLKFIYLGLHLLNSYLVWKISSSSPHCRVLTIAYLVCPILLFEQVCNGHVDIFACTAALLLIRSIKLNQFVGSGIAIWIGTLSRTIPIIWLPLISVFLVRNRRWNSLVKVALISLGLIVVLSLTLFKSPSMWLNLLNSGTFWQTAGSAHDLFLGGLEMGLKIAPNLVSNRVRNLGFVGFKVLLYLAYCGFYGGLAWKGFSRRKYLSPDLITDLGWATLALLLLAVPWYQPWYASILLPFILFANSRFFQLTALTFAVTGSCAYYLLTYDPSAEVAIRMVSVLTVVPTTVLLLARRKLA